MIFDIFKKKKEKIIKKEEKEIKVEPVGQRKRSPGMAYQVLYSPHITEKATILSEKNNKYIFKVWKNTNKTEIKRTIEDMYGVDVVGIKIINIPAKKRRIGRQMGWKKSYKKAIIKLKKGQKIEILPR